MPGEAVAALDILALCDRFRCLPSALMNESSELYRLIALERMVKGSG
jgi:hypothetical protein